MYVHFTSMQLNEDPHMPMVTVVISTYNRKALVIEAIRSVIDQTYSNWELFIADDGSTDDTVAAIKAMADSRIQVFEFPHTGQVGPILNECAGKGTGKWICFLDSDDVWLPQKLERQVKALQENGLECCYTNYELMDEKGKTIPPKAGRFKLFSGNIIKELLARETTITIVSIMLSRELFNRTGGFSTDLRIIYLDYEFELRMASLVEIHCIEDILLRVREHAGRTTSSISSAELHTNTAIVYDTFIAARPGKELEKIALTERNKHLRAATKLNFRDGKYLQAFRLFKKILIGS
ncbi:MAG: glycosyltransferase [Ferruginibacter sp.]